jgi:NADPH:quinone reductase-like Zn-dependent oxidoreductase
VKAQPARTGQLAGGTTRAAYIVDHGPADAIVVGELPAPARGPADVLVAVTAAAVNQVDTYVRSGRWPTPLPFPFVVGRDLVGTVAEGDDAGIFRPGEPVWANSLGHSGRQGATSELAVVPAERLYRLPPGADPMAAVAALHPAATAFIGLHLRARIRSGDTVLIGGAAGSVGSCAAQLAAAAGCRVIGTARPGDHARCRALGADHVFDYRDADLVARVLDAAPGGVDLHWDTSGHGQLAAAVEMTRPGGRILVTAGRTPQPATALWPLYTRDITLTGFVISRATAAELAEAATAINRRLGGEGFGMRVTDVLPLDQTAAAHARVESGQPGRLVIAVGGNVSRKT